MSSSRLFLGRLLSSRACLRFADRVRFSKTKPRRTMIFQRTATTPLTPCLSPRVQSSSHRPPAHIVSDEFPLGYPWARLHPCRAGFCFTQRGQFTAVVVWLPACCRLAAESAPFTGGC